jgi:ABC-2 type transport system permease protein
MQAINMQQTVRTQTKTLWRSFRTATWLGWQIESNWTDPFLFAVYSIVKPLASAGILVIMYSVITQGDFESPVFPYIYIGNAFYIYVGAVMTGVSWAVIDDREHYKTLKYMYVAPIYVPFYLLGRGIARILIGTISVSVTILFGLVFLKLPLSFAMINWPLFFVSLIIGIVMLAMMGLILAGIVLLLANHVWFLGEIVAGALYVFSGAIFPLEVLPAWLRPIGYAMPVTYWLELIRRSLVGNIAQAFPTLAGFNDIQLLGILSGLTLIFGLLSFVVFRWCEHQARERGMLDMVTNY